MSCRKPTVAQIRPDLLERFRPRISAATKENLTDKLEILIEDETLREELGEEGREYVLKTHTVSKVVDKLREIYKTRLSLALTLRYNMAIDLGHLKAEKRVRMRRRIGMIRSKRHVLK